jgi:hypothetical protein
MGLQMMSLLQLQTALGEELMGARDGTSWFPLSLKGYFQKLRLSRVKYIYDVTESFQNCHALPGVFRNLRK